MICLKIFQNSFCFLNCHLAAGPNQSKMDIRRQNAFEIMRSLRPYNPNCDMPSSFDYFFWMGDFNFRVDCRLRLTQGFLMKSEELYLANSTRVF